MNSGPVKILLVEDHTDTAKMMRVVLERQGYDVHPANNATQALAAAEHERFDVCLCDLRLPDGDGKALSSHLLSRYGLKCICLSGDITQSDLEPEPGSPFTAYLAKPLEIPTMFEAIRRATE